MNTDLFEFENWGNQGQPKFPEPSETENHVISEILEMNEQITELPSFDENITALRQIWNLLIFK